MEISDVCSRGNFYYDAWSGDVWASLAFVLPEFEDFGLIGRTSVERQPYVVRPVRDSILFASTFSSLDGLDVLAGFWSATVDGLAPSTKVSKNLLAFGDDSWDDVRLDVSTTLRSRGSYGVFCRSDGESKTNGYTFVYDPSSGRRGEFMVEKYVKGKVVNTLASSAMPKGFEAYGSEHKVSITVVGDRHAITLDDEQVLGFTDDSFSSGMAGLGTWSRADATFHDAEGVRSSGD